MMSRDPFFERKTSIAFKTEEKTVLRGYNLSDLAEEGYSFCDAIFVLFQGRIPTEAEEQMLNYEMGSFLEHSMSPSAGSAIAVTAGRPNLPTAVAAGVMTFGGVHGPGAAHGYMMNKYIERAQREGKSLDEMAKTLVEAYVGVNVVGAGNAALSDLGFAPNAAWCVGSVSRGYSCAVHAIYAMKKGRAWAASSAEPMVQMLDLSMIKYIGPEDREVPSQEERAEYAAAQKESGEYQKWVI